MQDKQRNRRSCGGNCDVLFRLVVNMSENARTVEQFQGVPTVTASGFIALEIHTTYKSVYI